MERGFYIVARNINGKPETVYKNGEEQPIRITDPEDILYGKYIHKIYNKEGKLVGCYSSDSDKPTHKDPKFIENIKSLQKALGREI